MKVTYLKEAIHSMQCQCGNPLPMPLPRFCPYCGAATATLLETPAPADLPQAPSSAILPETPSPVPLPPHAPATTTFRQTPTAVAKSAYVAPGLLIAGVVFGGISAFMALLSLIASVLLILEAAKPDLLDRVPTPWLRRPRLGTLSAAIFVLSIVQDAGISFGMLFFLAGTILFLRDAAQRGELGPFDPRLLLHGWRTLLLVGVLLASFTFSAPWDPSVYLTSYSTTERTGGWETTYYHPGRTLGGASDAHSEGAATIPSLLLLAAVLWASWRGKGSVPAWFRYVPVGLGALLVFSVIPYMGGTDWTKDYSGVAYGFSADGPFWFVLMLLPFFVGAIMLALGRNGWRRGT